MTEPTDSGRRRFLRAGILTVAALPLATVVRQQTVRAMPQAEAGHALNYVNDASNADPDAGYQEGQRCDNCAFWAGQEQDGWGQCHHPQFADVMVRAGGWCSGYAG